MNTSVSKIWLRLALLVVCVFTVAIALHTQTIQAAAPGGVTPTMWFKANDGPNGSPVSSWNDKSPNGYNAGSYTGEQTESLVSNGINFNPVVRFAGNGGLIGGLHGSSLGTNTVTAFAVAKVSTSGGSDVNSLFAIYNQGGSAGASLIGRLGANVGVARGNVNTSAANAVNRFGLFSSHITTSGLSFAENGGTPTNAPQAAANFSILNFGIGQYYYSNYMAGDIAEIAFYNGNQGGGSVESYLAIKYGLTLRYSYTDSSNTAIWTYGLIGGYDHDITGIGRDDASALNQKQSQSTEDDSIITIGHGSLASTNAANANNFSADKSFLMWANNNAPVNAWVTADAPTNFKRIGRTWRVQQTGTVGAVTLAVRTNNPNANIPAAILNYYLLYDTNSNGNLSDDKPVQLYDDGTHGDVTAHDGHYTINGITLNNGNLFTVATQQPIPDTPLTTTPAPLTGTPEPLTTSPAGNLAHDEDGISDDDENKAHNNGDGNGDGIPDSQQNSVSSIVLPVTGASVTFQLTGECHALSKLTVLKQSELPKKDAGYNYPLGLFDYDLTCSQAGQSGTVKIYLDKEYSNSWITRKFNRNTKQFSTIPKNDVIYGAAQVGGVTVSTITYTATDGGPLDEDGQKNGVITDPVGPAVRRLNWWVWVPIGAALVVAVAALIFVLRAHKSSAKQEAEPFASKKLKQK